MRYFPFLFAENKNLYSLWKSVSGLFLKPSSGILGAPPYAAIKNNAVTKGEMKHEHSIDHCKNHLQWRRRNPYIFVTEFALYGQTFRSMPPAQPPFQTSRNL